MTLLIATIGATVAGSVFVAAATTKYLEWKKTRDGRSLVFPVGLLIALIVALFLIVVPQGDGPPSDLVIVVAGGVIGAALASRAIFGVIRYTRQELAGNESYRGGGLDLLAACVAAVPVLALIFLFR